MTLAQTADIKNVRHRNLTVQVGTEVTWVNQDGRPHTTTSGRAGDAGAGALWDSDELQKGGVFRFTFNKVGEFPYFCRVHGAIMQATITVVESLEGQSPAPTEEGSSSGSGVDYTY